MRLLTAVFLSAFILLCARQEALADVNAQTLTPEQRQAYETGLDTCIKRRESEAEIVAARKAIKNGTDRVTDVDFDHEAEIWIFWEARSPSDKKVFADLSGICILTKDGRTLKRMMLKG